MWYLETLEMLYFFFISFSIYIYYKNIFDSEYKSSKLQYKFSLKFLIQISISVFTVNSMTMQIFVQVLLCHMIQVHLQKASEVFKETSNFLHIVFSDLYSSEFWQSIQFYSFSTTKLLFITITTNYSKTRVINMRIAPRLF